MYFFFCRLYLPPATTLVFASVYLSSYVTLYRRCGVTNIYVIGEVAWEWDPKRRRAWASHYSILSDMY